MSKRKDLLAATLAEYILDFEDKDFEQECDDENRETHVYYVAYRHRYGDKAAREMLNELRAKEKLHE